MSSPKDLHKSRMNLWDASINSHAKLIDTETGLFYSDCVETRACPVCGSNVSSLMFNKEGGTYVKCRDCTMVYLNPVLKDQILSEYYTSNHSLQSETVESDTVFYNKIYSDGLGLITPIISSGKLLDIGCSSGFFLDICRARGFNTYGVELNEKEAMQTKKRHIVLSNDLNKIDEKFDVITMWDVFEHIKNGKGMLETVASLLNQNGVLFLQIPSSASLAARILQADCNVYDGLEHVNLYNIKTISKLANSAGFSVLDYRTVITESLVLQNYLNYEHPYLGQFDTSNILFTDDFIIDNDLGYKIQMILKVK